MILSCVALCTLMLCYRGGAILLLYVAVKRGQKLALLIDRDPFRRTSLSFLFQLSVLGWYFNANITDSV